MGKFYLPGTKAQLIPYIVPCGDPEQPARFDCTVLDGAVVVLALPTGAASTFEMYASGVFIPYL